MLMKKNNKKKLLITLLLVLFLTAGCTKTLKGEDKKVVTNPETGQSLTENILCQPESEKTIEADIRLENLEEFKSITKSFEERNGIESLEEFSAMQSELLKKAQPELEKLEKKYKDKTDQASLMKKSQEMTMIYKKYNINPVSGCLYGFIQLPLFIAFLEAINRVPALFEETFRNNSMDWNVHQP